VRRAAVSHVTLKLLARNHQLGNFFVNVILVSGFLSRSGKIPYKQLEQLRLLVECESLTSFPIAHELLHQPIKGCHLVHEWISSFAPKV
jgi:hypothetical protein